jgi:high affinity Mn2+ porin
MQSSSRHLGLILGALAFTGLARAQNPPAAQTGDIPPDVAQSAPVQPEGAQSDSSSDEPLPPERWTLSWQATSVGEYHGTFQSPYEGPFSLQDRPERDVSLTTTLFAGFRLERNTALYFNPEIAGGRGFSGVDGLANPSNGELPRVATATPKPYIARLYITHDFALSGAREYLADDVNQLSGERPVVRYTITAGRFALTDFFDNNNYSHDPRQQFLGWAVMSNGAWDYPADLRGYTWGWVHELHLRTWSFRYASAAMPKVANGSTFDRRLLVNRGDVAEEERRFTWMRHPGNLRVLEYMNHGDMGTYAEAIRLAELNGGTPEITATRRNGTRKYGMGVSFDQEISKDIGLFGRLGWNDGKTESFVFTAMDRLATGGVSMNGRRWHRPRDTVATELTVGGISGVHASYLAMGGSDFLIGDGALRYGPEYVEESYYSAQLLPGIFATIDAQHVTNPAYNEARGPLWIGLIRLHLEVNKETFSRWKNTP